MVTKLAPSYEIIKSTKKIGFINAPDRRWQEIDLVTNNKPFVKYNCSCVSRPKAGLDKSKHSHIKKPHQSDSIEVILKPYSYSERKKVISFYLGQCTRCETVFWIDPTSE